MSWVNGCIASQIATIPRKHCCLAELCEIGSGLYDDELFKIYSRYIYFYLCGRSYQKIMFTAVGCSNQSIPAAVGSGNQGECKPISHYSLATLGLIFPLWYWIERRQNVNSDQELSSAFYQQQFFDIPILFAVGIPEKIEQTSLNDLLQISSFHEAVRSVYPSDHMTKLGCLILTTKLKDIAGAS